jgi:riboflavin kinase
MAQDTGEKYSWSSLYENQESTFDQPILLNAEVVHGFKRGSKELGIPTANLSMEDLGDSGHNLQTGIYYGWAKLNDAVYPAVVSVGWNPFYHNTTKTGKKKQRKSFKFSDYVFPSKIIYT